MIFLSIFLNSTAQLGIVLEITSVEDNDFFEKKFRKGVM